MEQPSFSLLKNQKKRVSYKVEKQKIINLLNDSSNEESKLGTKKWYVTDRQSNTKR